MKTLPGQELKHTDYSELLKRIDALLWELVYKPVVDLVRPTLPPPVRSYLAPKDMRAATPRELRNALEAEGAGALKKALQSGAVQMIPDATGQSAIFAVAKPDRRVSDGLRVFGARLNKKTGYWTCAPTQVPVWVRLEVQSYALRMRATHDQVNRLLDDLEGKVSKALDEASLAKASDHAIEEVAKGWKESARALEVVPDLGAAGRKALEEGFSANAKIPIKNWAQEAIARLREQVDENAMQGYRAEGLAERIRNEYGMSKNRADLIARQETNNFMAVYRQARARDAGLKRYVWTAVMDARTRKLHRDHNGEIYRYDSPPIVDERTGQRGNPGQSFRCRCVDRPVIE